MDVITMPNYQRHIAEFCMKVLILMILKLLRTPATPNPERIKKKTQKINLEKALASASGHTSA